MATEPILALSSDVNRLLIAGGSAAAGDEGLRKRARALRDLAGQVAALVPVAEAIDRLTDAGPDKAPAALLDLLLVVRRLCASLATTTSNGKDPPEPLPPSGPWQTPASDRDAPAIIEALPGKSFAQRETLTDAVRRGVSADLRLVPVLFRTFESGSGEAIDFVLEQALPSFDPQVLPELWRGLKLRLTRDAAWRLMAICRTNDQAGAHLCLAALAEDNLMLRQAAVSALGQIRKAGRGVMPELIAGLGDEGRGGRAQYAEALGSLADEATEAVPALCAALKDRSPPVRSAAATALARIGSRAAVPALEEALKQELDLEAQQAFQRALARLQPRGAGAR
jgi:HEAT repeat protein